MQITKAKSIITKLLNVADVQINGQRPWDITVHQEELFLRVLASPSLGLGEAYMDGWWDCAALDEFFYRIVAADLETHLLQNYQLWWYSLEAKLQQLKNRLFNQQTKQKALVVAEQHYDLGNDLYQAMLDEEMNYTCGYWKNADNLDAAQLAKLELVCQKLQLQPGMRLLDIGCGWGGLAKYAASRYGVNVVGVTISKEQHDLAQQRCIGLPIEIRLQDYRDVHEKFDRIASLGMFEHVGYKNYQQYFKVAAGCLKEDGLFLLHTIGSNRSNTYGDAWTNKYIFPNSMLPGAAQIARASESLFIMEDWHNFGAYYDKTLLAWYSNFQQHWPALQAKYNQRFYRMWSYYLLSFAGLFRARGTQLWQIVFSKRGVPGVYPSVR